MISVFLSQVTETTSVNLCQHENQEFSIDTNQKATASSLTYGGEEPCDFPWAEPAREIQCYFDLGKLAEYAKTGAGPRQEQVEHFLQAVAENRAKEQTALQEIKQVTRQTLLYVGWIAQVFEVYRVQYAHARLQDLRIPPLPSPVRVAQPDFALRVARRSWVARRMAPGIFKNKNSIKLISSQRKTMYNKSSWTIPKQIQNSAQYQTINTRVRTSEPIASQETDTVLPELGNMQNQLAVTTLLFGLRSSQWWSRLRLQSSIPIFRNKFIRKCVAVWEMRLATFSILLWPLAQMALFLAASAFSERLNGKKDSNGKTSWTVLAYVTRACCSR